MNIGSMIDSNVAQTKNGSIEKYCYRDSINNCNLYGGLYQWNELMQFSKLAGSQGICPSGWHVPTDAEWTTMERVLDPTIPTPDTTGWRGTVIGTRLRKRCWWYFGF